ncbi:ABC-2 type transport system ATP-binding protein [Prauserella halophila]|nr:ABC-2 type transport system ATP-binding protein [Prauserella halophila]
MASLPGPVVSECGVGDGAAEHPAVEIENLVVRYPSVLAVDGLSHICPSGRITALLGPNGAGKSSVLGAVSTAVPADSGEIRIFGHDLRRRATAARARLGLVFQERTLDKDLSVQRNLWFHARLFGMGKADARERIDRVLAVFGLGDRRNDDVQKLSGGLARRVEVARALLHRPGLLVLDEPTTGLDPEARWQVWQDLRRMRTEFGVSILFSTHYMDEAEFADEIAIINEGKLVRHGSADELKLSLGSSSVLVRTEDDAAALANLSAAGHDVRFDAPGLVVRCAEPEKAIAQVVASTGTGVLEASVRHPTMDDVYLSVTAGSGGDRK